MLGISVPMYYTCAHTHSWLWILSALGPGSFCFMYDQYLPIPLKLMEQNFP